jgi:large subunit ribosomal protein L29
MDAQELRGLSKQELNEKLDGLRKQLMEYQFKRKTGIEKPHLFGQARRDIARILTILKEKRNEK